MLLDEPLAALDKKIRERTQFELMSIQEQSGLTFIVVTHDQEEAMALSDRIAVMDKGEVRQIGSPTEIYEFPNNKFVASFIGAITSVEAKVLSLDSNVAELEVADFGVTVAARAVPGLGGRGNSHACGVT